MKPGFYNTLLTLAVLPAVWKMPDRPISAPYISALAVLVLEALSCLWNRLLKRFTTLSRKPPISRGLISVGLHFLAFGSLVFMASEDFSTGAVGYLLGMPLVAVVGMKIAVNSWKPTPPEEVSLVKDGFFAFLLGYVGLVGLALVRTLFFWQTSTLMSIFRFLGMVFPVLVVFAAAVVYRNRYVVGRAAERTRLLSSPEGVALVVLLSHFIYFETALVDFRSHLSQMEESPRTTVSLERLRRARTIFRNYRMNSLAIDAEREVVASIHRHQNPGEVFGEVEYVERNFPDLRMEVVNALVTPGFLKDASEKERFYGNVWRDFEFASGNSLYMMDRWGRLFARERSEDLELKIQSPFQIFPDRDGKAAVKEMAEAVDFELSADKRNILILDSLGRVFGGGIQQGQIPYRVISVIPMQMPGRDLEFGSSGDDFYAMEGSGLVWHGLPLERNSEPEEPLWNWDIARSMQVSADGLTIMDGLGGIHCFGDVSAPTGEMPYWSEPRAVDLEYVQEHDMWMVVDHIGDLYFSNSPGGLLPRIIKAEPPMPFTIDAEFSPDMRTVTILSRGGEIRELSLPQAGP